MDFNKFNFDIDINFDENEENEETIKKLFLGKVSFFHHACRIQYQNIISVKLMSSNDPLGPWYSSYSIPGEKLTYLHVKTTILAKKLEGASEKSRSPGGPWGVQPKQTFGKKISCIFRKSQ